MLLHKTRSIKHHCTDCILHKGATSKRTPMTPQIQKCYMFPSIRVADGLNGEDKLQSGMKEESHVSA